jgi:hypothetical protein
MGTKRRSTIATHPDFTALRRMTRAASPDPVSMRAILDRVGARPERMRFKEGAIYIEACQRYREISGEDYGPRLGVL